MAIFTIGRVRKYNIGTIKWLWRHIFSISRHRTNFWKSFSLISEFKIILGTVNSNNIQTIDQKYNYKESNSIWKSRIISFPHSQGEIPASGSMHPSRWPPLARKQNRTGVTRLFTCTKRGGHLNWLMGLPALLGGNLGCGIIWFTLILYSLWGMSYVEYIMALRPYSILDILLSSIIIITQDSSQALNTHKYL